MVVNHDNPKEVILCDVESGELFVYNDELYIKSNRLASISDIDDTPGDICIKMSDGHYAVFNSITKVYKACVTGGVLNYVLLN